MAERRAATADRGGYVTAGRGTLPLPDGGTIAASGYRYGRTEAVPMLHDRGVLLLPDGGVLLLLDRGEISLLPDGGPTAAEVSMCDDLYVQ